MGNSEESSSNASIARWDMLVKRWDAAYANLRAALKARELIADDEGATRECDAAEAAAREELEAIRRQMDAMISQGLAKRSPPSDKIDVRIMPPQPDEVAEDEKNKSGT